MASFAEWTEEQKKKKKKSAKGVSFTEYTKEVLGRDDIESPLSEREEEDIAPVRTTTTEEKDNRKWFEKGAFEDGYDFGDVTKTILGTGKDVRQNLYSGVIGIAEKTIDAGAYLVGGAGKLFGADEFASDVEGFIEKDLINEEKIADVVDTIHPHNWIPNLILFGADTDDVSLLGEKTDSLVQSGGQLAGTAALQMAGVPWWVTSGVTSFGGGVESALKEDATYGEAGLSAAITAGAEILTEKLFGGSGLGEKGLINLEPLTKGISNKLVKVLADYGVDMFAEGTEEVVAEFANNLASSLYKEENLEELLFSEEALDGYLESFVGGSVLGGGMNVGNVTNSIKTGKDYRTGLTANEQKVFDKVYEDMVAEAEKNGKVTQAQKDKIYNEVLEQMEKGYISTDTIEEVLGDKSSYDSLEKEAGEYDTLYNTPSGQLSKAQQDRLAELEAKNKENPYKDALNTAKEQYSQSVFELVKGDRLSESYNERTRRTQAFEADLTQYDAKQQGTIKRAVESGILNNTNRTHEFVDLISKISADKGVLFDFTNNQKLKDSGFAVDGKTVNGYVTKDGVTLNIDSTKSLNSVTGHEITHILEGTELYTELQNTLFEYAKSKGEYDSRLASLTELYKNVKDADVNAELTADLVGDYLFTDADFINRLSTEHRNIFQKIYDEIKYLCKVATAGSKEARELERVKKVFEEAYRNSGQVQKNTADSGVKYSLDIKHSDGTVERLANARNLTSEQAVEYLYQARSGELRRDTYFPVRKDTPQVLIDTLGQVNDHIENLSMVMNVDKAQRAMAVENPGTKTKRYGDNVRKHGLSPEEIVEVINNLDNPTTVIYQTNRYDKQGNPLPNSVAVFVEYSVDGREGMAAVEFENPRNTDAIGEEFGETNYHTVITVFEPDIERNGMPFDYAEELLSDPNNYELEIKRRQTGESATGEKHPNTSNELPSSAVNVAEDVADVKPQFSLSESNTAQKVNASMTMQEAKRMLETAFKVNNIAEYYEGEYANAEDWLKKAGSDEVEMYIENDFDLQAKYINSNEDILNEEYRISDVLDAYLAGTLVGKAKPKPTRLDVSQSTKLQDNRFYSPQKIEDAKTTYELAIQKAVGKDANAVNRARAEILLFAHNKGAAELLGVTQADLNRKLRSWSNYSATARNVSERINAGVAEENRWTGIENSAYINKAKVTNEDIERLVASVEGDSRGYERKYIARVMLAADTHIDYSGLKFKFATSQQVNADHNGVNRVHGFYDDTNRLVEVSYDKPNTVAHEMGHYIDAQWGRDLLGTDSSHLFLTRGINADMVRARYGEPGVQFLNNFNLFINSLSDVNTNYNSYYNDRGEIFARFFAKFVEWTDNLATGNKYYSYESTMYGDKFNQAQYVEFARLLQEKALLDGSVIRHSLSKVGETPKTYGRNNVFGKDIALESALTEDVAPVSQTETAVETPETEQNVPITENVPLSPDGLAEISKKARREEFRGAYTHNGKQYLSDGSFIAEFNTVDETLEQSKDFPAKKALKELDEAYERQISGNYNLHTSDTDGYVKVGDFLYDAKYVNALIRAIENPAFSLSNVRGGDNALLVRGDNGRALLMPVRAGDNVNVAYEAEPIGETAAEMFPDDLSPVQTELDKLNQQKETLESRMLETVNSEDLDNFYQINTEYESVMARIEELENEISETESDRVDSLTDADIPPETDAPYYGTADNTRVENPFDDRDWYEVGNRKVKAYMYENPEVKPFFQQEAMAMMGELADTTKGERFYDDQVYYASGGEKGITGVKRHTSASLEELLDSWHMSYADIEKGLTAIIEDNGAENIAAAKKLEFMLNDRLLNGYQDFYTNKRVPPNQDYINLLNEKQINEYSKEAFDSFMATADQYAPVAEDITPVTEENTVTEDIAPVAEKYEAIRPKRKQSNEPKLIRVDTAESTPKQKQRKWVGTSTDSEVVDHKVLPEDLNQELIHYQPISNKKTLGNANAKLDSMGYESSVAYLEGRFANKDVSLDDIALGERLIQEAVKRGDTKTAGDLIMDISILGTELGQKVQALSIINRLTPEGQLKMLQRTVQRGKTKGDKAYTDVEVTQDMIDKILSVYNEDGTYDQTVLNEVVEDAKQKIADQMGVTALEKVNAWRYLSMLGNPKTHIRNLVSNVAMKGTVAAKNAIARSVEDIAPIKNRTKTWRVASDDVKAFAKRKTLEMKDVISSDSKYSESASIKDKRATFKNKILNGLYEFNSDMLSKEDWWFSKPAFTNALSECLTANGIRTEQDIKKNPEIVAKAIQYATEQSQIATFRQYSWLSNKINEIERKNTITSIAVGSILPFKKTPINIAKTGLNYSPLGFAKTLTYDISQVKKGNMEASELVDHLAQNVTGAALTLVGYMLASSGFINGAGDDDKEGDYDYQLGKQSYSVNIGGATFSLSWLSPVAMPLFVGANAYEQLVEGKEWNGDVVVQTLAQTLDPLSEMSFISSLDSVLSSYDSGIEKFAGIGESMVQNYITQFVPTLSGQIAATFDDTKRSTKVAADSNFKFFDETVNKLMYKIPGLRNTLEPSTDIWGNEIKQSENVLERAFESFLAPYAKREDIATEIDEEIKDLYRQTGDSGVIPSIPYNYLNYDGEKYEMSAKEFTEYKKKYGQNAYDLMEKLFDTETYQNADSETRADMVNRVYDYARDIAKLDYFSKRGVKYTNATEEGIEVYKENPIKGAIEDDLPVDEYVFSTEYPEKYSFFKKNGLYDAYDSADEDGKRAYNWAYENPGKYEMSKLVFGDFMTYYEHKGVMSDFDAKDENGETVSGLKKERVINYINGLDLDYGQKIILLRSMYSSKEDRQNYNADIVEYLNERSDISYSEMETILEELGFKVSADGTVTWD